MQNEIAKPTHITKGNVFDDLGFSAEQSAILKFKSELYVAIMKHARKYSGRREPELGDLWQIKEENQRQRKR